MSELDQSAAVENASFLAQRQSQDAGALLKQAREAAGLHIGALAVALKVPVRKLEALESGRFDLLPDAVFARALASSVCRNLKIDPAPVLALLPAAATHKLANVAKQSGDKFYEPGGRSGVSFQSFFSHPVAWIVSILVVASAVVFFLPYIQASTAMSDAGLPKGAGKTAANAASATDTDTDTVPSANSVVPLGKDSETPLVASTSQPPSSAASGFSSNLAANLVAQGVSNPQAISLSGNVAPSGANATLPNTTSEPNGIVVLKTRGTSWVEVTDAKGIVQLRKIMVAGESVGVSGGLPLSVTVGKADAVEVQVRGKPFDLALLTKDNVARFEVR